MIKNWVTTTTTKKYIHVWHLWLLNDEEYFNKICICILKGKNGFLKEINETLDVSEIVSLEYFMDWNTVVLVYTI